mgnify:CR=1 FL=1
MGDDVQEAVTKANFKGGRHPRDKDGQFDQSSGAVHSHGAKNNKGAKYSYADKRDGSVQQHGNGKQGKSHATHKSDGTVKPVSSHDKQRTTKIRYDISTLAKAKKALTAVAADKRLSPEERRNVTARIRAAMKKFHGGKTTTGPATNNPYKRHGGANSMGKEAFKPGDKKPGDKSGGKPSGGATYDMSTMDGCKKAMAAVSSSNLPDDVKAAKIAKIKAAMNKLGGFGSKEAVRVTHTSRVVESKVTEGSNRIFGIKVIEYGTSKNGRRYPEGVMRLSAPMYEGAKVYDHHRTDAELKTSTINGVVGFLRNVEAQTDGLYADLHLLPSATHAAEALDASLVLQQEGLNPLVGISHDVLARFKHSTDGGKSVQEAVRIESVQSADIVAQPAAGGAAVRVLAGGSDTDADDAAENFIVIDDEEMSMPTLDEFLGMLKDATDDQLASAGLSRASTQKDEDSQPEFEFEVELVGAGAESATESVERTVEAETYSKNSWTGKAIVRGKCEEAELPEKAAEAIVKALPERFTEADVDSQIAQGRNWLAAMERDQLKPTLPKHGEGVGQEAFEKKVKALDYFFDGKFREGYHSFIQAYADITGDRPGFMDEDFSRKILQESCGYRPEQRSIRSTESMDTTTWNVVLGDSITRKMVAEYSQPGLDDWKNIVSSTVPVNDFRTQRIDRIGGYDLLPGVNQGAPYQPLVSPADEEVTYALTKRGGTEDITLEMIANDDVRSISKIPSKLGLSAALTLHRFVWAFLTGSANIFDSTALFTSGHANLAGTGATLSQSKLTAVRAAMRKQLSYGDANNILSLTPRTLIVPTSLEEIGYQITKSAVAVPSTPAGPSDTPNLHSGMNMLVLDHITDDGTSASAWYCVADPSKCPTVEMGFYQGKDIPELFTQADNNVGSMFDNDKITYKIRHIYSGAVLDYRGFYKVPVA